MLGDVTVSNEEGRVKWTSRKCRELFAYLLLYRGRRIPRSRLIADIFGGMEQGNAENYLNTTVYQLRKSLEPLGMREVVRSENDGYVLETKNAVIDYVEFESGVEELQSIEAEDVERAMQIERLYTGDLFGTNHMCGPSAYDDTRADRGQEGIDRSIYRLCSTAQQ